MHYYTHIITLPTTLKEAFVLPDPVESLYILSLSEDTQTIVLMPEFHSNLEKTGGVEA